MCCRLIGQRCGILEPLGSRRQAHANRCRVAEDLHARNAPDPSFTGTAWVTSWIAYCPEGVAACRPVGYLTGFQGSKSAGEVAIKRRHDADIFYGFLTVAAQT